LVLTNPCKVNSLLGVRDGPRPSIASPMFGEDRDGGYNRGCIPGSDSGPNVVVAINELPRIVTDCYFFR
jgi:hypothetical protein